MNIWIEFPWNYEPEVLEKYLEDNKLSLIQNNKEVEEIEYLKPGMALKHESGVIMRVMTKFNNYENLSHDYLLDSKSIKPEQLKLFRK